MCDDATRLSHKSDAGGVLLNLTTSDAVRAGWTPTYVNVAACDAMIALDGVSIQVMGAQGPKMIVGAKHDPEWVEWCWSALAW